MPKYLISLTLEVESNQFNGDRQECLQCIMELLSNFDPRLIKIKVLDKMALDMPDKDN